MFKSFTFNIRPERPRKTMSQKCAQTGRQDTANFALIHVDLVSVLIAILLIIATFASAPARAQEFRGTISGAIANPSGADRKSVV